VHKLRQTGELAVACVHASDEQYLVGTVFSECFVHLSAHKLCGVLSVRPSVHLY